MSTYDKTCLFNITLPPSLLFYAIFFRPSIPTLLLPLLFLLCRCHDNSSTAPFICWRPGLPFLWRERARTPLTYIHNTPSTNAVTEAGEELSSTRSSQEKGLHPFFGKKLFLSGEGFGHLSALGATAKAEVSPPLCPAVTISFFPLFLPPPPLAPPVTAISA